MSFDLRVVLRALATTTAVVSLAACRDMSSHLAPRAGPDTTGLRLAALYGNQVNGEAGSADDAEPLVVALWNGAGQPVPNVQVTWSVAGSGSIQEVSALTGSDARRR